MNILRLLQLRVNAPTPGEIMRLILAEIRTAPALYQKIEESGQGNINLCLLDYSI